MSEQQYREKDEEKAEEKEQEKRGEKQEKEEKSWDEKWRRDPLSAIVWAAIFIWAGFVLLAENLSGAGEGPGWFASLGIANPWAVVLIGAAVIVLLEVVVRLLVPAYRRAVAGSIIIAAILFVIGFGMIGWRLQDIWPAILIILGLSILLGGLLGRGRR